MTRRVALIGTPLNRRHSEVMHNAAFAHYGVDASYELRELAASELPGFFSEVREGDWLGFQVTAPYKETVITHLDTVEDSSRDIGAVNSVIKEDDGTLTGFNTDASGFLDALTHSLGVTVRGTSFVVVGAGGAARAVVWALLDGAAGKVVVANRSVQRAVDLANDLAHLGDVTAIGTDLLPAALDEAEVAVNATTVGMTTDGVPFEVAWLPDGAAVFDLVYVPPETPLVEAARNRGLRVCNGLEMLVSQAAQAFERWTGIADAAPEMRRALQDWERMET